MYFKASLTDEQKRGTHPYKGIILCRSCWGSSNYLQTVFPAIKWTIPDSYKPIQCLRCRNYHTKPIFTNISRSTDSGRRHICIDCIDYAYELLGTSKNNSDFVQVPGPHLHPDHPHIRGLI